MKWTKLTLQTTSEAVDFVSAMLAELGVEGIEIEDKVPLTEEEKNRMFIDILPELGVDDGKAEVSFYLDTECNIRERLQEIEAGLAELRSYTEIGEGLISISETEDVDWMNNWKQYFKPFRVDEDIWIKPSWEALPEVKEGELVIEIDPGTAFGTGSHETTRLCILNMKKYLKQGDSVLDVGCGSGILSIIAKKLGAARTVGIDIDENAVRIAEENAKLNAIDAYQKAGVPKQEEDQAAFITECIELYAGNVIDDRKLRKTVGLSTYNLVVANILADIIIPLSAVIGDCMKPGAVFISSGIIKEKEAAVTEALTKNGFDIREITRMGDWVSIVANKYK